MRLDFPFIVMVAILEVLVTPNSHAQCTPLPSGLVAWWRAEGNALDSVGTNHGTLVNGATFAPGEVGTAFSFNATNLSYVEIPYSPSFDINAQGTIQLWHKLSPTQPTFPCLISRGNNADRDNNFEIYIYANNYYFSLGNGNDYNYISDVPALLDDQWHHLAFTWDGTTMSAFVDGVLKLIKSQTVIPATVGTPPLVLGSTTISDTRVHLNGQLDEVALFNRALTTNEIAAIYTAGSAGMCGGPEVSIALYPGVKINGVVGQTYGIQCSTNLSATNGWFGVTNLQLTVPTQIWYDSQPDSLSTKFFRVVPGPISIP